MQNLPITRLIVTLSYEKICHLHEQSFTDTIVRIILTVCVASESLPGQPSHGRSSGETIVQTTDNFEEETDQRQEGAHLKHDEEHEEHEDDEGLIDWIMSHSFANTPRASSLICTTYTDTFKHNTVATSTILIQDSSIST